MSPPSLSPDQLLAQQVAAGDRQALEQLYLQHAGAIYRFALTLSGNGALAADATQETFLQFALRAGGYREQSGSLGAYLCGIARFQLLALLRQMAPGSPLDADAVEPDDSGEGDKASDPCSLLVQRQSTESLLAGIRRLPWVYREAVTLVDLQEHDYAEAAQIAAVPINTLRTRLHRGRQQLAQLLASPSPSRSTSDVPH